MRKFGSLVVVVAAWCGLGLPGESVTAGEPQPCVAAGKKVKTSVSGTGKSKSKAESEAAQAARDVAGSINYRTIRKNTTGSGESWTCSMTIEYTEK